MLILWYNVAYGIETYPIHILFAEVGLMKIAIIGSRGIGDIELDKYMPAEVSEIVSGGAVGVDSLAEQYAKEHNIPLTVFLPEYKRYGRAAPLKRNEQIANYADTVLAFWDGKSRGTKFTIDYCKGTGKPVRVCLISL